MTQEQILTTVRGWVDELLGPDYRLYLYGSRAKGNHSEYSDFDLLIRGPAPVDDVPWQVLRQRCHDLPTLYKVELVDYHRLSSPFRSVVEKDLKAV